MPKQLKRQLKRYLEISKKDIINEKCWQFASISCLKFIFLIYQFIFWIKIIPNINCCFLPCWDITFFKIRAIFCISINDVLWVFCRPMFFFVPLGQYFQITHANIVSVPKAIMIAEQTINLLQATCVINIPLKANHGFQLNCLFLLPCRLTIRIFRHKEMP